MAIKMERIRLDSVNFFSEFDTETVEALLRVGSKETLAGGKILFRAGDPSTDLYVVISGRLIIVRDTDDGEEVVGYVSAGELVGEMSLLSNEAHSASAYALRDTKLFRLKGEDFQRLFETNIAFARSLTYSIMQRTRHPSTSLYHSPPRVFALVSSSPSVDVHSYAKELKNLIGNYGRLATIIDDTSEVKTSFADEEARADIVLLPCKVGDTDWYRFVLRQSDRIFVFARRDARPPMPFPLSPEPSSPARRFRLVDLVAVHEGQGDISLSNWVSATEANRIFHWRRSASKDRLARSIIGKTVALVLSGGGARAYAHIGALKAINEHKLPIDFVGGASMGAIIAACVAMGWDLAETEERIRDAFVESSPLSDHVLPVVALTRGKIVDERLKRHFGDILIENLDLPFYCVSSELTSGIVKVHRRGLLRQALRASISLPGVLPPVVDGSQLLVDGAVLNNFPTDVMQNIHRGLTIGVDVAREGSISTDAFRDPPGFFSWIRKHGIKSAPPIVSLLMRSATARHDDKDGAAPDVLIRPSASGIELRHWTKFDQAVNNGYDATLTQFDLYKEKIAEYVSRILDQM